MNQVKFQLDRYGTAKQLGFECDMEFFKACVNNDKRIENVMLLPEKAMRPDGIMLLKRYVKLDSNGRPDETILYDSPPPLLSLSSLSSPSSIIAEEIQNYDIRWIGITLGCKFYTNPIPRKDHKSNVASTDLRLVYYGKEGKKLNKSYKNLHVKFHKLFPNTFSGSFSNLAGMLRILVELPRVASKRKSSQNMQRNEIDGRMTDDTQLKKVIMVNRIGKNTDNDTTRICDIIVHIYSTNMQTIFKDEKLNNLMQDIMRVNQESPSLP